MSRANTLLGLLKRFPGYTLRSLLEEDVELLKLVKIQEMGNPEQDAEV